MNKNAVTETGVTAIKRQLRTLSGTCLMLAGGGSRLINRVHEASFTFSVLEVDVPTYGHTVLLLRFLLKHACLQNQKPEVDS